MALNFNSLISESTSNNQASIREIDKNDTCEDIIIKELHVDECNQWSKSLGETWRCVFSNDEQYFAFQSTNIVKLVSRKSYLDKNASNTGLTINCDDLVRSLLFVKIKDTQALSKNFRPKSAKYQQLFLVTGHYGRIRIWDIKEDFDDA